MKKILLLLPLLPLLSGCTGIAGVTRALAKDPATVSAKINTVYGTASLVRIGAVPAGSQVTVSPDGTVTIKAP